MRRGTRIRHCVLWQELLGSGLFLSLVPSQRAQRDSDPNLGYGTRSLALRMLAHWVLFHLEGGLGSLLSSLHRTCLRIKESPKVLAESPSHVILSCTVGGPHTAGLQRILGPGTEPLSEYLCPLSHPAWASGGLLVAFWPRILCREDCT